MHVPRQIVIHFKWVESEQWKLSSAYTVYESQNLTRWKKWMFKDGMLACPIAGRAVLLWSLQGGVKLIGFHPPRKASWLTPKAIEIIRESGRWTEAIKGGYALYAESMAAVDGILSKLSNWKKKPKKTKPQVVGI